MLNRLQDLQIQMLLTNLPKENQGPVVFLSLPQNICECVRHLSKVDISRAKRLNSMTEKLDEIYLQDTNISAYMSCKEFYFYKRDIGVNINNFLVYYECLYQK